MKRTNPRAMIATTFLMMWFITTVFLYSWNIATGTNNYRTPFTEMMLQAGCIPTTYINGTLEHVNSTSCNTVNGTSIAAASGGNLFNAGLTTIAMITATGALVSIIFPNVWGIFAAFSLLFMWWISFPLNVIGDANIPFPVTFVIYSFYFLSGISVLSWWKGGDLP